MRIGFFLSAFPTVSETFVLAQIAGLVRRGHDVHIFARGPERNPLPWVHGDVAELQLLRRTYYPEPPAPDSYLLRAAGGAARATRWIGRAPAAVWDAFNPLRHGWEALSLHRAYKRLPRWGVPCDFDVIHCHFGPNGLRAVRRRAVGTLRGPIVTSFHGYDANQLPRQHGLQMYEELFRSGELLTVGSAFMRERLLSLGAPAERIEYLPMGVDLTRFRFEVRRPSADGTLRILTIARLVEVKGLEYALHAIALVKEQIPGVRYRIVGDGPLRAALEARAAELGLSGIVEFRGAVPHEEAARLYQEAQLFLLPSIVTASGEEENQPVVLAEAQACGLPVIATGIGGIPESIRDGVSGILVQPRDPEGLAAAIRWLAAQPEAWSTMGRAGREHVEQGYDLNRLNDRLVEIYHAVRRDAVPAAWSPRA